MRKVFSQVGLIIGLIFLWSCGARAQVAAVSGNLRDLGVNNATSKNTYVLFTLSNFGSNIPRVVGTNAIVSAQSPKFVPDGSGNISGNIQKNNSITPTSTFYRVCIFYQGTQFQCNNFLINADFNLNSATPITTTPVVPAPTGDATYARLDGGNQPFTAGITLPKLNKTIHVDGSKYVCSDVGIKAAIADLLNASGQVVVDGCAGAVPVASNVAIPQGVDLFLMPSVYQVSSCPGFTLTGESAILEGTGQGSPVATYSTSGPYGTVIQAVTGCAARIANFNILAGSKGATIRNLRIDANSISGAGPNIEVGPTAQVSRNVVENVSLGGNNGGTCLKIDSGAQNFFANNIHANGCGQGVDASGTSIFATIIENSRFVCGGTVVAPCVVAGPDSPANGFQDFELLFDDIETNSSSPTALIQVQSGQDFKEIGGWRETNAGSTGVVTMTVVGDANVTPSGFNSSRVFYEGNNIAAHMIEFNHVTYPYVDGDRFYDDTSFDILVTSTTTAGRVTGNRPNGANNLVSAFTGLTEVDNYTSASTANDFPYFPLGLKSLGNFIFTNGAAGGNQFTISGTPTAARVTTLPDASDTVVELTQTQTLTNKIFSGTVPAALLIANQGAICTNGELGLSAGWQSTGAATVTAVAGLGQTCNWTITTGTTTGANPTVTDTLTNPLPTATTVCEMNIHGGTHTAAAGEGFTQTALSATAPIFTFIGTPTAGGTTYFVTRRCGP